MPLPMVHLGVAGLAAERLPVNDLPAYYLGCIAPDGVHMLKGWTPEDKNRTHLGTRSSHDPAAVGEFLRRLPELPDRDYAVGYALHILTDVYWVNGVVARFDQRYYSDPQPVQDRRHAYYNDTDQLDLELYRTLPGREELWGHLKQAKAPDLPGLLPGRGADLWNQRLWTWFDTQGEFSFPLRYLSLEEVQSFLPEAANYAAEYICSTL